MEGNGGQAPSAYCEARNHRPQAAGGFVSTLAQLSSALKELTGLSDAKVVAVAYSRQPTDRPSSYLPVFTAGSSLAQSLAAILDIPAFFSPIRKGTWLLVDWEHKAHLLLLFWRYNCPAEQQK